MLLLMLVSLSCVVASDVDDTTASTNDENLTAQHDTDISVAEQSNQEITNDEQVSESDQGDSLLASSNDEDVLGGTIVNLNALINNGGSYIRLTEDYYATGTASFPKSDVTIDGQGHTITGRNNYGIYTISSKSNVVFKNINFINGNRGSSSNGGAIQLSASPEISTKSKVSFINCTFINCSANQGGAIGLSSGAWNITIENCTFDGCTARSNGGALFAANRNTIKSDWNIINSKFTGCNEQGNGDLGGGVAMIYGSSTVYLSYSNFTYNTGIKEGICIRYSGSLYADHCLFDSNKGREGVLCSGSDSAYAVITNSIFKNNNATRWGAALQVRNAHVYDCEFINNSAYGAGDNGGGAIYARWGFEVKNSIFIDNYSPNGGAIHLERRATNPVIENCTFRNNTADYGGAVYIDSGTTLSVYDSKFYNNSATDLGGAIYSHSANPGGISISDSEFINNTAVKGGAIYSNSNVLEVTGSKFTNNIANDTAGAIYAKQLTLKRSNFNENHATDYAGALFISSSLSVERTYFEKNYADIAGAVYTPHIIASNVYFIGNYANSSGALQLDGTSTRTSTISDSEFENNNATQEAGAIYFNSGAVSISNTNFLSNYAGYNGGAILWKRGKGDVSTSTFKDNFAGDDGAAIYWEADDGLVSNSQFENNNVSERGGAIYWHGNSGKITRSTFTNNFANTKGNAVYWYGNDGTVQDSTFDDHDNLGSIYWHGANGNITFNTFIGEKGVYICEHADVYLGNNLQTNNNYENYSIYNNGVISLSKNEFYNAIYNYGKILTNTSIIVLENKTIVTDAKYYDIFTEVLDDNNNNIKLGQGLTNLFEGVTYTPTFNNTCYVFRSPYLQLGIHYVYATGDFSNLTNNVVKSGAFMYMILDINVTIVNNGEQVIINTTVVNTTENGTIELHVNHDVYNVPLVNGTAVKVLYNVDPGMYIVTSIYGIFNQTIDTGLDFIIDLRNSTIIITARNITAGQNNTIMFNVTNGTTGTLFVILNGNTYTLELTNSTAHINLTNMDGGIYHIYAFYYGDDKFKNSYNSTVFTVTKMNATLPIIIRDNILVGETAILTINATSNLTGTFNVYVNGKEYIYTRAPISINLVNMTAGNYSVRVMYSGDGKYNAANNNTTFKVSKRNIIPVLSVQNIKVGDNETITVTLNGATNAKGGVVLTVNGNVYYTNVNNTRAIFKLTGLPYGKYNVTATYLEDDTYYSNTTNGSFRVDYVVIDPIITYSVDDNLDVTVNVTVPVDANGDIIIEVDGQNYTSHIVKGLFSVPINDLEGGVYPAKMYFANDTKYQDVNKSFNITLKKIDIKIHIISEHIEVGENATIIVTVTADAGGNVTVRVNGTNQTLKVINGTSIFTFKDLKYGNYTIYASFSGDRKYNPDNETAILIVRKVNPNPYSYINVTDIYVGEIATFNITMPGDITAKVDLTIQNKTYTVNVTNGFGQINISGLKYGYPVKAQLYFAGNEKYLECNRTREFAVHRISNYPINITADTNATSVNITVNIPKDANGTGYFTISNETFNKTFTIKYTNGKSNMTTVNGLLSGKQYVVYAFFEGNEKYDPGSATKTLNSNKTLDYTFNVTAKDIFVGQVAYIHVILPNITNGTVTLRVPGRDPTIVYVNESFVNGTYDFAVYDLRAGSYLCSVTYGGNDIYEASTRYGTLLVSKINTSPIISFNTTYVGQNLTIRITLPSDSNGTVNITINNVIYGANVTNGTAYVIIPGLAAKTYPATLFYSGNEKYNNCTQNFEVTILKVLDFLFDLSVMDIKVGDNETVTIKLPADIDVNVTVTIPGTSYINKTFQLVNGTVTFNVTDLKAGEYNVTASITNSSKYIDYSVIRYFTVSPRDDYLFNLHNLTTVYVRDNITFILDLPKDAIGNVTVFIFGNNYTGEVKNGTATINVTAKKDGTYAFRIWFEQKGKYNYKYQDGYAVVIKKAAPLNPIYNATVNVDQDVVFEFILPKDATGNVSVTSRGKTYTAILVNGSAIVTLPGYPLASIYSPAISYTGDDKYYSNLTTATITVTKVRDYDLNVSVANITVDEDEIVNISLPNDVTEDVLISGNFSNNTYSVKLVNGTASFKISDLAAGNYSINVRYQGYQKYADKNVTLTFNVRKVVPPIDIEFKNNDTIVVILPTHANGNATIVIKNNESVIKISTEIEIVNGRGVLNVSNLRPGNYSVNATFSGDARYLQNSTIKNIAIPKIRDYILPISVENIIVGENATIIIIVPENATGFVNITINDGNVIQVPITGNIATYNATGLKVGNYTVKANYSNVEYDFVTNSTTFEVFKIKTLITDIIIANATNITINVTLTDSVYGGNLTIKIDNKEYNFTGITTNKINLTAPILPGEHDILITYYGDENHTYASKQDYVNIDKIKDYTLTVNATSLITVLDQNVIVVTLPKNVTGNVHIYINNESYGLVKVDSATGKATLTLPRLASGNYTVIASFSNEVYDYKENTTNFTVIKLNTTLDVQVNNITKDLDEIINITLNETATGEVLVNIYGTVYHLTLDEGKATLPLSNLDDGNYTAIVTYLGSHYFNTNTTTVYFTVSKIPVNITINTTDIVVGQIAHFDIVASRNITSQVTVTIGKNNYTTFLYKGKGQLIVEDLKEVGYFNVTVIYDGDEDYLPATNKTNINVTGKLPTSVKVNVTNITVGDAVTIHINVTGDVNGTVTISMLGNPVKVQLVNGTGNYTYYNLTARDYHFTVDYYESEYFLPSNATGDFTVFKRPSPISANVTNATVGSVEVITVYLPINATGTVLLTVNGSNYYTNEIVNGVARFNVTGLPIGNHTAYIKYEGNDKYLENETRINLTTDKLETNITIITDRVIVDGHPVVFNITTSANFTEVVTVTIVNRANNATVLSNHTFVENGKGTFIAYNLLTGNYTAYVYFPGNTHYDPASNSTNFTIRGKAETSLNVSVDNITLGETAVIYVNVTGALTGKVTLNIAGDSQTKDVVDGKVNFTVPNLSARDYHVTVTYLENDDYLSSNATTDFTVYRKAAPISANVTNATVGSVEIITVYLPTNATGTVLLTVNGSNYFAKLNNSGVAKFDVIGLPVGNHTAYITYEGDNNYLDNETKVNLTVAKLSTTINITSNANVIVVGHPVIFTIETSANFTEVILVKIVYRENGTVVVTENTFVENGKGTYIAYDLAAGNYIAYAYFPGNTQYGAADNNTNFSVSGKSNVNITVKVDNITLGENATVYVNVTAPTGKVTLNIAGNSLTKDVVDGKVNFTVPNLSARDYHVTVTYLENDDYLYNSTSADFTVFRKQSDIQINVTDIYVGENETVIINVTSGATGIVLIDIAGVQVYAILNNSYVEVIFDDLGIGKYNVTATYLGDDNYFGNSTNTSFKVTKLDTTIIIEGSYIVVGQTEIFNITTSANITEVITIEINGTNHTTFIENGKGTFIVPYTLNVGNYTVYVYFPGNSKYDPVQNSTDITVSPKMDSAITVNVESITVGDDVTIYVNVTDGATGIVAISIAGNAYSILLNNSRGNITLSNLTARNYHVSAFYFGDDYYLPSNGTADFVVNKKVSQINVTAIDITVDDTEVININITNGTTGVVLIDINGTDYYANIIEGIATLSVQNLPVGTYNVTVRYNGDANYSSSVNSTKFNVTKLRSNITVEVMGPNIVAYGNDVLINITGPKDVTGIAIVTVKGDDETPYTVYINNGEGLLIITKPNVDNYTVSAVYQENYKYLSNSSNTDEFEVYANGSSLNVKTHNIYVGDNETIVITIAGDYEGQSVNITIDGIINLNATFVYNGNSSVATLNYTAHLDAGIHQVDAAFVSLDDDGRNVTHSGTSIFIVSKSNSTVGIVSISDIKVGDNVTINLTLVPSDASGTIDVYVNGELHVVNVNDLTLTLSNLSAGHYIVQAMYGGDAKYLASSANASFDVYKNAIELRLDVESINVGETEYLNVTLVSDATGYVLININGTHYYAEIKDGVARVNITDLGLGNYNVNVTYVGNDKYYSNSTTGSFNVSKLTTTIEIKGQNITVGQTVNFIITTSANITEVVTIEIDGRNYTAFIENGKGNFSLTGLGVNNYTATVYFPGNSKYGKANNETKFKVIAKKQSAVTVNVTDIIVGQIATIKVNVTEGATGNVTIIVAGNAYTKALDGNNVVFTLDNLTARDYHVTAFYRGDEYYLISNNTDEFTVSKLNTTIDVVVTNSTVGSVEYINVTVNANATGNILISIGDSHYYAEIDKGVAKFSITGLLVGNYTANITYLGNAKFNNKTVQANITISKIATLINITGSNITEGQSEKLVIRTSENITALVKVQIGNVNYTTFISEGVGELIVENLIADTYTATVYYAGDDEFIGIGNSTTFVVTAKKNTEIAINVDNITVGANATIKVTITPGATGNVTIVIAGHEISKEVDSATGEVTFEVADLIARNYEVTAIYRGDTYYGGNETVAHFTVNKMASAVDLNVSDIVVGNTEIINVTVTSGATGVVLINISGSCFYADLKDGMATFKVPGLTVGTYEAVVTYLGDEMYVGSNASKTFVVQAEITLTPGANNGNKTPITIDVGDNSTGNVIVTINGTNYAATVENGTATVYVDSSNPGTQNATVTYTPEGKDPIVQNTTVDIPKVTEYPVDVSVVNVDKENKTATIRVQAPNDATGNVTVTVGGKPVTVPLDENGTAVVTIKDLDVGSYDVDVSYDGDDKYVSKTNKTHVNMPINLPTVNVVDHLVRGWNSQFDYEAVFTNEFGEVLVDTNITFIVNGNQYTVKTESHGIARLAETLPVGEYTVESVNPVTGEKVTKKLSIVARLIENKDITMDFIDGTYYTVRVIGDDGNPVGEGEIIDIYVNTIHYVAKTDKNGYARLKINLNPKSYTVKAYYKNYQVSNKLVVKQTLKLVKKTVSVKKGKKLVLKAKLKWSNGKAIKGKVIKFKFNKKTYKAKTNSKGIAKVTIKAKVTKNLKKGKKYNYSAVYKTNIVKGKVKIK